MSIPETPYTRLEMYLDEIARKGGGGGGGGGGGSSSLSGLTDVDISNPADGQTLIYNTTSGKWENGAGSGGVLVIAVDPATGAMNKTWNEIISAEFAVIVSRMEGVTTIWDFVGLCTITSEGGSTYYDVSPASSAPNPVIYRTDSPNGYPTYYSP